MKSIALIIIALLLIGFSLDLQVSIRPFYIKVGNWHGLVGIIFVYIGIHLMMYDRGQEKYFKGYKEGLEEMRIEIQKHYDLKEKINPEQSEPK